MFNFMQPKLANHCAKLFTHFLQSNYNLYDSCVLNGNCSATQNGCYLTSKTQIFINYIFWHIELQADMGQTDEHTNKWTKCNA